MFNIYFKLEYILIGVDKLLKVQCLVQNLRKRKKEKGIYISELTKMKFLYQE